MTEQWLPIPGYEGLYDVSDQGRVRSYRRQGRPGLFTEPKVLRGGLDVQGYPKVYLGKDGKWLNAEIHRLVMLAFVGPPPEGHEVRHLDGVRDHSHLSNLAYGTRWENVQDRLVHTGQATHCANGHEWTPENTYRRENGWRRCKACHRRKAAA